MLHVPDARLLQHGVKSFSKVAQVSPVPLYWDDVVDIPQQAFADTAFRETLDGAASVFASVPHPGTLAKSLKARAMANLNPNP